MCDRRTVLRFLSSLGVTSLAGAQGVPKEPPKRKANLVFISAETENHSADTLSRLAQQLESKNTMRCKVLTGSQKDIPGIEAIEDVDLAILYVSLTELPAPQLDQLKSYVNSGKPLVALRTSLQGFQNWKEFGPEVLGARWQFDYGAESTTVVSVMEPGHPVVKGVAAEFPSRSPLYQVVPLAKSCKPLLVGKSVGPSDRSERTPNPVAWINTRKRSRVFYTSLGHPDDFSAEPFRQLLVNAVSWALNA